MSRSGFEFGGWYDNPATVGTAYTKIEKGSHGNKTFYAKWITPVPIEFEVSSADVEALNAKTPFIIVSPTFLNGADYVLNGSGLNESYDEKIILGFNSITAAMTYLSVLDLKNKDVYVFAGTYSQALTINVEGTYIYGPNYNIHGHDTRNTEATVSGLTDITASNVTINGLKFTGDGAIKVSADYATISHIFINANQIKGFGINRKGCIVDGAAMKGLTVLNSWIKAPGATQSYTTQYMSFGTAEDLTIKGNYIENDATTLSASYGGMRIYNVKGKLDILENEFHFATTGYVFVIGEYAHTNTTINIIDNIFGGRGTLQSATIQIKNGKSSTYNIRGNQFINFGPATYNFKDNNDETTVANITYNYYDDQQIYRITEKGSLTLNLGYNCYMGEIGDADVSGAATEATKFETLAELQAAYAIAYPKE